ncbi:ABC transporter substrate-binding protein [Pendulispora rubella]|uniref:ABC transporter substrate-binding protein n=1 Tax=Pendulispora rubella TaxID=2741070 RepID=A0ABZ2KYL3_9BACT
MSKTRIVSFACATALVIASLSACRSRSEGTPSTTTTTASKGASPSEGASAQYFPLQSYRVGPYAAGGTGFFGGFIDYLQLVNERDGGVNGVKLVWSECETEYVVERGVECYERLKGGLQGAPPAAMNPLSVGIAYALIDRATADKIPLITINHGRTDSTDGRVFPYVFPLSLNPYSEASAIVNYIGQREGGADRLRGKKIAVLYHGSPYGKETIPIIDLLAKKLGFTATQIEVPHPGSEQQSQWLQIRQNAPDWVILRGWGIMNPVALKTATKVGFPVDHVIGNVWSNSEEDVLPAGPAGVGYTSVTTHPSGRDFDVLKEVDKYVLSRGKGNMQDPGRVGSVYYNLGIVNGILNVEAVRVAQKKFGNKPLTGEQVRWGFEHIAVDDARLRELGAFGLMQPIRLSCSDHEGGGAVRFQKWDGKAWSVVSEWVQSDRALLRPIIESSSLKYAQEKGVPVRDCEAEARL